MNSRRYKEVKIYIGNRFPRREVFKYHLRAVVYLLSFFYLTPLFC